MIKPVSILFSILVYTSFCAFGQNTLTVFIKNKKYINNVDHFYNEAKYDSVYYYGNKILETKDLTYKRPVYKYFARTALAQKDYEKCKKYWYRAVEYGLFWNRIDTNARKILSHKTYLLHHKKYKN